MFWEYAFIKNGLQNTRIYMFISFIIKSKQTSH